MQRSIKRLPSLFGAISTEVFLREYWQRKPLLIRAAIADFTPPVSPEAVIALAARDDVESRLVNSARGKWRMDTGPFDQMPKSLRHWTLLVQGVNLVDPGADALMRRFSFLPHTRLDDLMISYAVDGGSVGAHFDSYDVFLLQAQGRRRWRIGAQKDLTLRADTPLKILEHFEPEQEFELDAGDMLYLPPQYAHEGIALGACMTYSIGFRAPSFEEMLRELLYEAADAITDPERPSDAGRKATTHPGRVDDALLPGLRARLDALTFSDGALAAFLGRFFSEPKAHVFFESRRMRDAKGLVTTWTRHGVELDLKTNLLYDKTSAYANGESIELDKASRAWIAQLSDHRALNPHEAIEAIKVAQVAQLFSLWHANGWIHPGTQTEKGR